MKAGLLLSLLPLLTSASPVVVDTIHNGAAPILSSIDAKEIPDSYIVVFKKHVSHSTACTHHNWVRDQHSEVETLKSKRDLSQFPESVFGGLKHTFNIAGGLLGYSGHFDEQLIERVRNHPDVRHAYAPRAIEASF